MRIAFLSATLVVFVSAGVGAQYGHPLKGSWSGDWGPAGGPRNRLLVDLQWDGKAVTGTINPGADNVSVEKVEVDYASWAVHIEARGKDSTGRPVRYVIDGRLDNLGSYNRTLKGTWVQGGVKGDFTLTRN
jgi:hypothetical protein